VAPIGFTTVGGNGCEGFPDASLVSKSNIAQRDVWRWFDSNSLHASFDDGVGSCWESDNDGGSRGKSLLVVDSRKEREDGREVRRVAKQESGQWDTKDFSLVWGPLFSSQGMDG